MSSFDRLHPALQHHIVNSLGWKDLRPVQNLSIQACLDGANSIVLAPTAGGKTEAAFFPVISQILSNNWKGLSVLYVSPIKALLNNQEQRLQKYFELVGLKAECWHGDTKQSKKKKILSDPPNCLLTTPESIEAILVSVNTNHQQFFHGVKIIVIDELHAFAGDDRGWHLLSVFSRIQKLANTDLQRLGLSATVGNPKEMLEWVSFGSERPKIVVAPPSATKTTAEVQLDYVGTLENAAKIISLLHVGEKRLVFCDSRSRVEQLALHLRALGIDTYVSHSSLGIEERTAAEQAFAEKQNCVIVATSSLELGLDVGDLDRVIQIDAPFSVSSFMQRMGRTGRRSGTTTNCLFLATNEEGLLRAASILLLWKKGFVEPVNAPAKPLHILAQQIMALILQEKGIGKSSIMEWLKDVPAFHEVNQHDLDQLLDYLIGRGILWSDEGLLHFAKAGEDEYGRKNFMGLMSVFTSPPLFKVFNGKSEIGNVHESTFYKAGDVDSPVILVLAGRNWKLTNLDWKRRIAYVETTIERGQSRWVGEGQNLSFEICQAMKHIVSTSTGEYYWSERTKTKMQEIRMGYGFINMGESILLRQSIGEVQWYTFAGGLANYLLADAISMPDAVKPNNLFIKIKTDMKMDQLQMLISENIKNEIEPLFATTVLDGLKFSECLPESLGKQVFKERFKSPEAIETIRSQPIRFTVEA